VNRNNLIHESQLKNLQAGSHVMKIDLFVVHASTEQEIEDAFAKLAQEGAGAAIIPGDPFFLGRRYQIVALAARYGLPTVSEGLEFPKAGGLMNYGTSLVGVFQELGDYTGRILKGARPEDLPVEQPTKFELVINLKTAKAIGVTIPQSILGRADEVIE
jgi:putative ABC transport system substrate-binding protein